MAVAVCTAVCAHQGRQTVRLIPSRGRVDSSFGLIVLSVCGGGGDGAVGVVVGVVVSTDRSCLAILEHQGRPSVLRFLSPPSVFPSFKRALCDDAAATVASRGGRGRLSRLQNGPSAIAVVVLVVSSSGPPPPPPSTSGRQCRNNVQNNVCWLFLRRAVVGWRLLLLPPPPPPLCVRCRHCCHRLRRCGDSLAARSPPPVLHALSLTQNPHTRGGLQAGQPASPPYPTTEPSSYPPRLLP
jgi:hypothetical protein